MPDEETLVRPVGFVQPTRGLLGAERGNASHRTREYDTNWHQRER
jgi:hypothetical protein